MELLETNEQTFERTANLYDFWQAGGTWSMDQYVRRLLVWEKEHPEAVQS